MADENDRSLFDALSRLGSAGAWADHLSPRIPTMSERFAFTSALTIIGDLLSRIRKAQEEAPETAHMVVTMRTPDGSIMDVESVWPEGFATFRAEGYVNGMKCFVVGHISTLCLFCAFDTTKGRSRVGFVSDNVPTEPPPESEPTAP